MDTAAARHEKLLLLYGGKINPVCRETLRNTVQIVKFRAQQVCVCSATFPC